MRTITLLVGKLEGDRLPVQIIPNDGIETHLMLSALRIAENQLIAQLIQEAEERGRQKKDADEPIEPSEGADADSMRL